MRTIVVHDYGEARELYCKPVRILASSPTRHKTIIFIVGIEKPYLKVLAGP
jgi:hypothetical protein